MAKRTTTYKGAEAERESRITKLEPMNDRQGEYIGAVMRHEQVITIGSSGTGKTFIAATMAANALLSGDAERVILTRPYVSCGRSAGRSCP